VTVLSPSYALYCHFCYTMLQYERGKPPQFVYPNVTRESHTARALTAAAVERLKPDPHKRREIPDGLLHGLYLVIQPNTGAKSWAVRYRFGGQPCKLTLGPLSLP